MFPTVQAAADAAFDRYVELVSERSSFTGQLDLFLSLDADIAFWRGTWIACEITLMEFSK